MAEELGFPEAREEAARSNLRQKGLLHRPTEDWSICVRGRLFRRELGQFCINKLRREA
jgi:hypothetical protein